MDMCVDTMTLQYLRQLMGNNESSFQSAIDAVARKTKYAGSFLEGNLYNTVETETAASCKMLERSVENIEELRQYIDRLEQYVDKYLSCDYTG